MKNKIELFDDYAKCYITDKCFFLLDLDDVEMAGQYHWILNKDGYACAWINKCQRTFHRYVMGEPKTKTIDHINHNKLDNRRSNLRECSAGENNQNRSNTNNPLGVKGVYLNEWGTYRAQITINRKYIYLGTFQTLKEACDAYDKAAQEYFGEFAVLNNYVA